MNSGLHDAVLVGAALADVVRGRASVAHLDRVLDARREVARSYVKAVTHDNWKRLRESDGAARAAHHDKLRALAADPVAARDYLLRTSMIDSLRERAPLP